MRRAGSPKIAIWQCHTLFDWESNLSHPQDHSSDERTAVTGSPPALNRETESSSVRTGPGSGKSIGKWMPGAMPTCGTIHSLRHENGRSTGVPMHSGETLGPGPRLQSHSWRFAEITVETIENKKVLGFCDVSAERSKPAEHPSRRDRMRGD